MEENTPLRSSEEKIETLLRKMTVAEKVSLCYASGTFRNGAVPRLGIPSLVMSDGPHGVRRELQDTGWDPVQTDSDRSTCLPTGIGLAATWNRALAREYGSVLGSEARHRGKDVILGPGVNIVRTPLCGRNFEYMGEDPFLAGQLAGSYVAGVQSRGVAACVKHFALNNQEMDRRNVAVHVEDRALHEIYLSAFKHVVCEAGVLTVMGAYNRYKQEFCCHNKHLLNHILKDTWGFTGAVVSDWGGVHDTRQAALNGLDIEMGTGVESYNSFFLADAFEKMVTQGEIPQEVLDDKVRRILRVIQAVGMFDEVKRPKGARNTPEHADFARRTAEESFVLLKNENSLLPLSRETVRKIAVIGENATLRHAGGGGSSAVKALYEVTPLEGLEKYCGNGITILHAPGYPPGSEGFDQISPDYLAVADSVAGLNGWSVALHLGRGFEGEVLRTWADQIIDVDWSKQQPVSAPEGEMYSVRWVGVLTPPESGEYEFEIIGTDSVYLTVDGAKVASTYGAEEARAEKARVSLRAGVETEITVSLLARNSEARVSFRWRPPWRKVAGAGENLRRALEVAGEADVVLFFGGLTHRQDNEGADRPDMKLPFEQDSLLKAVAGENPNTAVFLLGGGCVEMPWLDTVRSVVQCWYPNMEGGSALARTIFGESNPSGKLPVTFYRRLEDCSAHALGEYREEQCIYKDGIFVGYRFIDREGIEPLFPFGHGLSYTEFEYSDLEVSVTGEKKRPVRAKVRILNKGDRAGAETVQLYVGAVGSAVSRPVWELKEFEKVFLKPGKSEIVEFTLGRDAFSYYDEDSADMCMEPGSYKIAVGASSRDFRVYAEITVPD